MKKIILTLTILISWLSANDYHLTNIEATEQSLNSAGKLNKLVSNLSNELTNNLEFNDNYQIAITSFVSLNNFKKTNEIGNIISENLIHELQIRGFKIVDYKTMDKIKIKENGDFVFSRNAEELRTKYKIEYILSGTLTSYKKGLTVNARILKIKDHTVIATGQAWIPKKITQELSSSINENLVNITQR
jgi:TolB-like protein